MNFRKTKKQKQVLEKKLFLDALNCEYPSVVQQQWLLKAACRFDRDDVVKNLLATKSVKINFCYENGQSAIFTAAENGSFDCFNLLLNYGADCNLIDKAGRCVLKIAVFANNFKIVDKLFRNAQLSAEVIDSTIRSVIDAKKSEALAIISDYEQVDLRNFIGEVSFVDKKRYSALHYASKRGFVHAVSKLIYAGSKIFFRNNKANPLNLAYAHDQYEVLSVLLSSGSLADIDADGKASINLPVMAFKWLIIKKQNEKISSATDIKKDVIKGHDMYQLLKFFRLFKESNDQAKLHMICQHFNDQLSLLNFYQLPQLQSATFIGCPLESIIAFPCLTSLCINSCIITDLSNLTMLQNLYRLSLCNNNLIELPESIKMMKSLRILDISHNKITKLALWLKSLPLQQLSVNNNFLRELPELLPKSLLVLHIQYNQIQSLSPLLSTLPKLSYITLYKNPIIFPSLSITRRPTKELLHYLKAFLFDTVPNNTIKLSLVGQEKAGKTSLASALKSSKGICESMDLIEKTDGLEITEFTLNNFRLRMFDLAGDIDYIETHAMFISEGTLYLAVFDLRTYSLMLHNNFFGRLEVWLSSIYAQAPRSRVLLVGTNADAEMVTSHLLDNVWQHIYKVLHAASVDHLKDFESNKLHECLICNLKSTPLVRKTTAGAAGSVIISNRDPDSPGYFRGRRSTGSPTTESSSTDLSKEEVTNKYSFSPFISHSQSNNFISEPNTNIELPQDFHFTSFKFPHILGYYEVSSLCQIPKKIFGHRNLSIMQLKDGIQNACINLVNLKPTIPRKWQNLQAVISKQTETQFPILSFQDFSILAIQCGFENSDEAFLPFLQHFHSCGEILHYHYIDELRDIIITDPQWLSNQLRTIISYREIPHLNDGIIYHDDVKTIWEHLEPSFHMKLIALFRQSGVFIPFDEISDLIPCRLPIGRPTNDAWPCYPGENENQVDYYFEFDNLPPTFFTYLISLVESKKFDSGMMKPLYYSNHIVYLTKSDGIPCDIHTKENSLNVCAEHDGDSSLLAGGLHLARFLSLDANSVENLLDIGRNSFQVTADHFGESKMFGNDVQPTEQSNRHRVHFQLLPHKRTIIISIRGRKPCCIAPETIDLLNRVCLTRYEALHFMFYVLCPVCVRKSLPNPSKFALSDMKQYDPVCTKGHDVVSWSFVMTGKCDYRPQLTSEEILINLSDNECPKLFVMIPVNLHGVGLKEFYTLSYLREGYAVHLLCEYPDNWHFLTSPGYRLTKPKDFVKKYGQRLHTVLKVLSALEAPARIGGVIFEPLDTIADVCERLNQFTTNLQAYLNDFQDDFDFLHLSSSTSADGLKYLKSCSGLQRREFQRFLNKSDEENRFGDLIPTFYGGNVLWLCEKHHQEISVRE